MPADVKNIGFRQKSTRTAFVLTLVGTLGIVFSCATDAGTDAEDDEENVETTPTEPRDPDELPGADTVAGEDPCIGDVRCHWDLRGAETDSPFDASDVTGAHFGDDGAITLDDSAEEHYIAWIPNTAEGTISRVDTVARIEIGRYRTGPQGQSLEPSRTSVRADGGVYVGNRTGESVTRIALAPHCAGFSDLEDIATSSGPDDVLNWGADDCLVWNTDLSGRGSITAIAAQDGDDGSDVWVGARDHTIWKLDGETGTMLFRTDSPVRPRGFALDDDGQLWIAASGEQKLGRIDTTICQDHGSCETEICEEDGSDCVKESISTPGRVNGIALDADQRVWLGGDISRYDRHASPGSRWLHVVPSHYLYGVAADEDDRIYGAANDDGLYRFSAHDPTNSTYVAGTRHRSITAVDIDHHGFAWAINVDHNDTFVVDPGPGLFDGFVDDQVAGFDHPDAYSDMTGAQILYDTEQRGIIRQTFEQCDPVRHVHTEWQTLRFQGSAEGGSNLKWRARAANDESTLAQATWLDAGPTPPDMSPIDLRAILASEGLERAPFVEIEAELIPNLYDDQFFVPSLFLFDIVAECQEINL